MCGSTVFAEMQWYVRGTGRDYLMGKCFRQLLTTKSSCGISNCIRTARIQKHVIVSVVSDSLISDLFFLCVYSHLKGFVGAVSQRNYSGTFAQLILLKTFSKLGKHI